MHSIPQDAKMPLAIRDKGPASLVGTKRWK
jgi:hypothetical protein